MNIKPMRDDTAEQRLIGGALQRPEALPEALDTVRVVDMHRDQHQVIWEALGAIHARGEQANDLTLRAELVARSKLARAGGDEYLLELGGVVTTAKQVASLAKHVRRCAVVRDYQHRMQELLAESQEPIEDLDAFADRCEMALSRGGARLSKHTPISAAELLPQVYADIERRVFHRDPPGYQTGIYDYDQLTGGLVPGEITVVAARPGMGKSALSQAWALGVARSTGKAVLIVSLEMSNELLGRRLLSAEGEVDGRRIRSATLNRMELEKLKQAADRLGRERIYLLDDPGTTILDARRAARSIKDLALVVIDYAQLMAPFETANRENREQQVAAVSKGALHMAKELKCAVVLDAQLNRGPESRQDKRPMLSDLRESGAIEQDAHIVVGIYREEVYQAQTEKRGIAELIVSKNRTGPTGVVECRFVKEWTRFQNFDGREHPGEQQSDLYEEQHA